MREDKDWKGPLLVAKPDKPFDVGLSRVGSTDVASLSCVGAGLGFDSGGAEV